MPLLDDALAIALEHRRWALRDGQSAGDVVRALGIPCRAVVGWDDALEAIAAEWLRLPAEHRSTLQDG